LLALALFVEKYLQRYYDVRLRRCFIEQLQERLAEFFFPALNSDVEVDDRVAEVNQSVQEEQVTQAQKLI
jgi:hypothetical protein